MVLFLRVIVMMVFLTGLSDSFRNSSGKIIFFFRKLGLAGGIYFLCIPTIVLLVEFTLPITIHKLAITLVE
jgi:hypothetical protein